jgi:SAM-dependent methyltransferase
MHKEAMQYVSSQVRRHHLNGTPRPLFTRAAAYVAVDMRPGKGVDIVADAATLDLEEVFDVVISTELLEHTDKGAEIVATARRHLAGGGTFLATMAGPGRAPHGASGEPKVPRGEHYENVAPATLEGWIRAAGFESWVINQFATDLRVRAIA